MLNKQGIDWLNMFLLTYENKHNENIFLNIKIIGLFLLFIKYLYLLKQTSYIEKMFLQFFL